MFIRTIAHASLFAGTVLIGLWAPTASAQSQAVRSGAKYVPMQSVRYDFGSKSMGGYFVDEAKRCLVTLMVYEKTDVDAAPTNTATRVRLVLNPGETAGLDSEEGRSLNFTCGQEATALVVDSDERDKLVELQKLPLRKTAANSPVN